MTEKQQAVTFAKEVAHSDSLVTSLNYHDYIRSQAWYKRRWGALQRAENRCQICNGTQQLSVHHRDYSRLGAEKPSDLVVLCQPCHDLFHKNRRLVLAPEERK